MTSWLCARSPSPLVLLKWMVATTLVQTFVPDAVNQLSSASSSGTLTVGGQVTTTVCAVAVNGQAAVLYFGGPYAVTNLALVNGTNTFTAIAQDTYWRRATNIVNAYLPATASFQYDLNGNIKYDGQRAFDYDAENQLIRVTITNAFKSEWVYDGRFRRRIQREYQWQGNQWVKTNETRFVCDGNLVIQERDSNNVAKVSYTRGADFRGSREVAGGIGGLVALTQNAATNTHYYYHSDGFGNVTGLVDTNAFVVARYEYDPFGRPIVAYGPAANAQPYGFSSKYYHAPSGITLYERRPYLPDLQRWATSDPIGELGGNNLYGFS